MLAVRLFEGLNIFWRMFRVDCWTDRRGDWTVKLGFTFYVLRFTPNSLWVLS
jgi:hypothetical protein